MNNFLKNLAVTFLVVVKGAVGFFAGAIGLLAASADTADEEENDISAGAFRGGTLNYRTDKLDDGTDPHGWYGND